MKKKIFSYLLFIIIILLIQLYLYNRTNYLNLSFYNLSGNKIDACKMKVTKDINLGSYSDVDPLRGVYTIDDKASINRTVDYLNNIPLKLSNKKSIHTKCGKECCSIEFYDDEGIPKGRVAIHGNVIQRSMDAKVFVTKEEYPGILAGLRRAMSADKLNNN